ncbi:MAG: PAS domain S-box protein [Telluria sp.]
MPTPAASPKHAFLIDSGAMGDLIAGYDWSATPLGHIGSWSEGMRAVVAMMLRSALPMVSLWGEPGIMIYNDAYAGFAGGRHPQLLGSRVREGWPEAAAFNDNVMRVCLAGGTLAYLDQEMTLHRNGAPEQLWMNLDYSPLVDAAGTPCGVIAVVIETTAKVRAERHASGERERLRTMFDQAPGFMAMLTGPEHLFTLANGAYLALVGYRDVVGRTVRDVLPEAVGQGFITLLDSLYASGEAYAGTAVPFSARATATSPARDRFVDFVYQPLRDEAGKVFGIFVQGADVTDRVVAEQALSASAVTFRTLSQAMPNQVWAAPADGMLDWFNDRVYEYIGAAPGELDGGGWAAAVHPDDAGDAMAAWHAAVASGDTYQVEFRIRRFDGVYRWHLVRALPVRGEDGAVVRWIGTNTDIEHHKEAERSLEQQVSERTADRDRMWMLATDIMLVADKAGRILTVNPAFASVLGWSEAAVAGVPFLDLVNEEDRVCTAGALTAALRGNGAFRVENRYRRSDGGYNYLAWTGTCDRDSIHAIGRDVTAEREAAEQIRRTELALQQSQKMETIGKLTGGVAHDFNNLLQVISGNLQLLSAEVGANPRAMQRVNSALGGVRRGAKLASSLLAFGRRQALEPKVVKLSRYVAAIEDMLQRSLGEGIDIETRIGAGLWNTFADVAQVENAILNLCINARDAMEGGGKLTIEISNALLDDAYARNNADVASGQYIVIAVSDTGTGMPPEVIAQAFDPFFSTKPEGKGTGLGLSMVYGFAKQSGGHVKIYSEVGHGTTVKLYLPRSLDAEEVVAAADTGDIVGGNETILVAEDDEGVRTIVVDMLSGLGYRVLKAHDAAGALAIVESGMPIDLLFTDVVMPGELRSPDMARRAREAQPGMAVLFTSGYTENAIVHGGRLDAGVELLGKPYTRAALARKIRHVLANQQQRDMGAAELALAAARPAAKAGRATRILLVEDDDDMRLNTAELLESLGHSVKHARSGEAALKILRTTPADVLVTDVGLPGMAGEELAMQARALAPGIGVVFASGQDHASALTDVVLLRKPFGGVALSEAVRAAVLTRR